MVDLALEFPVSMVWYKQDQGEFQISNERGKSGGTRINRQITASKVFLIGEENEQIGEVAIRDALQTAEKAGLDLVEVSPHVNPPVCKVMDFGKFQYQKKKKQKKTKVVQLKEIKLRPVTEDGDYQVKLRNLMRFIEEGHKVKVTIRFRGREITHQELAVRILDRLKADVEGIASIEQRAKMEGRQMIMILAPFKKSN